MPSFNALEKWFREEYYDSVMGTRPAIDFALPTNSNEMEITYNQSQARPLTSANTNLRSYSPFTMRVMPPLLYLDNPSLLTNTEKGQVNMGLYDSAISNNSNFSDFTSAVANYNQPNGGARSFSAIGNDNFATTEAMSVGARPTTKKSLDSQTDQQFESAITDFQTAEDIAIQLDTILSAPPITFFVNPSSFSITHTKKHQYTERTRHGYIYQAWGEDQPKIAVNGKIGSFVSGSQGAVVSTGHQFGSKLDSASFQQLMAILTLYKNNGYIYDLLGRSNAHQLVGCLAIEYDGYTYFGHIDTFEWGYEEANTAGGLTYNFNFVVSRMFDNQSKSTVQVKPLDSPIPLPNGIGLQGTTLNSTSSDSRLINRNVELQTFTQPQGNARNSTKNSQTQTTSIPMGTFGVAEEAQEEAGTEARVNNSFFIFNNSNGR